MSKELSFISDNLMITNFVNSWVHTVLAKLKD